MLMGGMGRSSSNSRPRSNPTFHQLQVRGAGAGLGRAHSFHIRSQVSQTSSVPATPGLAWLGLAAYHGGSPMRSANLCSASLPHKF
jgi:hypothetical protein